MTIPVSPDSSSSNPVTPSTPSGPNLMTGGYQYQPMTFLGMSFDAEQTKKLWECILRAVSRQIEKDSEKAKKSIRNFGKVPGDPDYED